MARSTRSRVRFLHTKDNAEIGATSAVRSFAEHFDEFSVVKKGMFKSAGPRKKFEAAVAEAKERHESGKALEGPWSDDDAVDEEEVLEARAEASKHLDVWKTTGHDLIGKHVARYFGEADMRGGKSNGLKKRKAYLAVITRWLPAEDGDLFHAVHDDGDEEDLDEHEARKSGALYNRQPDAQRRRHEILCRQRERQQRADAKARMPKKPLSAYHLFGAAVRPELAISHPEMSPPEMLKVIAARWRELPETERQQYDVQAAEEVKRYVSRVRGGGHRPGEGGAAGVGARARALGARFLQGALRGRDGRYALGRMHGRGLGGRDRRPRPRDRSAAPAKLRRASVRRARRDRRSRRHRPRAL